MTSDPLGSLGAVLDELCGDTAGLPVAQTARLTSSDRFRGRDDDDAVVVTVDGAGMVIDVEVAVSWRRTAGLAGLSAAVLAAAADAEQNRVTAWVSLLTRPASAADGSTEIRSPSGPVDRRPPVGAPPSFSPVDASATTFARRLTELVREVRHGLDDYRRVTAEAAAHGGVGQSTSGRTVAMVQNGRLVAVDCEHRWLERADRREIAAELRVAVTGAFRGAQRAVDQAGCAAAPEISVLRDLTADVGGLLAGLGFAGHTGR